MTGSRQKSLALVYIMLQEDGIHTCRVIQVCRIILFQLFYCLAPPKLAWQARMAVGSEKLGSQT